MGTDSTPTADYVPLFDALYSIHASLTIRSTVDAGEVIENLTVRSSTREVEEESFLQIAAGDGSRGYCKQDYRQ
jgi:hypothetical protein